jgi:cobalt/nickel transport system permease protein
MSSRQPFSHIPDIPLITWIAENNRSFFAGISPISKVVILMLLVVLVTVTRALPLLLLLYAAVLCACALARLPLLRIFSWYALPLLFVLSLVGLIAWGEPGAPVLSFGIAGFTFALTDAGLLLIIMLLVKTLIIVTYSFFFLMTTRYEHIAGMIDRIFPDPLNQIFLLSYRFLFLTFDMTGSLVKSVRSRGGGMIRSVFRQAVIFGQVFALTFIRSFDRAERVHAAMAARGYCGVYATATPVPRPSRTGIACLFVAAAGTAFLTVPEIFGVAVSL